MRSIGILAASAVFLLSTAAVTWGTSEQASAESNTSKYLEQAASLLRSASSFSHTDNFAVLAQAGGGFADEAGATLEAIRERFYASLAQAGFQLQQPQEKLTWLFFRSARDFDDYAIEVDRADTSRLAGYYSSRTNRVAVIHSQFGSEYPGGQFQGRTDAAQLYGAAETSSETATENQAAVEFARIAHEAAHQLAFNSGLKKRGVTYPLWIAEGLATNFEAPNIDQLQLGGRHPGYERKLRSVVQGGRLIKLSEFVEVGRVPADASLDDYYAQAWGLFNFLYNRRPQQLVGYITSLATMPAGKRGGESLGVEFAAWFGSPADLEAQWYHWAADPTGGSL